MQTTIYTQFNKADLLDKQGGVWFYPDGLKRRITCCVCKNWYNIYGDLPHDYGEGTGVAYDYIIELKDKILILPESHVDCRELYFLAPVLYED